MVKKYIGFIVVLIFATVSGLSLLHAGMLPTHDGEYHVVRFYEFDKVLRDGNLYPRWAPDLNNGFGVPLFNYVYPLPNYIASFFHFYGISFIDSFKLNMFTAGLVGSLSFYLWARMWWGKAGAVVSSVFYTYSPYHFVDIYVRGSVGEVWALALFPAALWSVTCFSKDQKKKYLLLSSIFLALIIFSHNILALMFLPFFISYIGVLIYKSKKKKYLTLSFSYMMFVGLGLAAIFWLPAILERGNARGLQVFGIEGNFPDLYQLIIPSWGTGFSGTDLSNQMSFQIGIANLAGLFLSFIAFVIGIIKKNKKIYILPFFFLWFLLTVFFMQQISLSVWRTVPFMDYFQFPWRFLSLVILISSFLSGAIFMFLDVRKSMLLGIIMISIAFFLSTGYTKPAYYLYRNDDYYTSRSNFIDGTNSPGNAFNTIWFGSNLKKEKEKLAFIIGSGKIKPIIIKSTDYKFMIEANNSSKLQVNTAYFPGWKIFLDSKETTVLKTKEGLFSFNLTKGKHSVEIKFEDTRIRKLSIILSVSGLFLLVCSGFDRIKKTV